MNGIKEIFEAKNILQLIVVIIYLITSPFINMSLHTIEKKTVVFIAKTELEIVHLQKEDTRINTLLKELSVKIEGIEK